MFQNKSPNIESFTRLKEYQPQIDQAGYCTSLEESLAAVIAPRKDSVIAFAVSQLKEFQSRDDYRELLELKIIFFGGTMYPSTGNTFLVSRCSTSCSLDGESHLFHKVGANYEASIQFSEAAESVPKRIISLLRANSLESPEVSQYICYSYLCEVGFNVHLQQALQGMI